MTLWLNIFSSHRSKFTTYLYWIFYSIMSFTLFISYHILPYKSFNKLKFQKSKYHKSLLKWARPTEIVIFGSREKKNPFLVTNVTFDIKRHLFSNLLQFFKNKFINLWYLILPVLNKAFIFKYSVTNLHNSRLNETI